LRDGGNRSGADAMLTAHTGYPVAVDFARGYPRYRPHDGTATALMAHGEVDAVIVVGSAAAIPDDVRASMAQLPGVVIGPRATSAKPGPHHVALDTGVAGIHDGGVALRLDDVPLPLRPLVTGPPATAAVVSALRQLLVSTPQGS
jgi:formylmethanofuran dehydrogenase subunit B